MSRRLSLLLAVSVCDAAEGSCAMHGTHACQLNGACVEHTCVCDKGWTGDSCGALDVESEATTAYGYGGLEPNTSSWGGGPPAFDHRTGLYHLFVSEFAGHCGWGTYARMSQAVHAVSESLEGPYARVDVVLPVQTHNTYYVYSPLDKVHLIYSIFDGNSPESCNPSLTCTDGTSPGWTHGAVHWDPTSSCPGDKQTYIHYSTSLDGPWLSAGPIRVDAGDCIDCGSANTNPAPFIFPNGTVIMLARSADVVDRVVQHNIHLYRADSWNSTYEWVPSNGVNGTVNVGDGKTVTTEDPVLYRGKRGFHTLLHSRPRTAHSNRTLTHGWSEDGLTWYSSTELVGPLAEAGGDNERPRVALDEHGDIEALFIGQLVTPGSDGSRTAVFKPVARERVEFV